MTQEGVFNIRLAPVDPKRTPLLCALSIAIGGNNIWPVANDPDHWIEIQIDDLFSYLAEFWKPLLLRQTYPMDLTPMRPNLLASEAAMRWQNWPQDRIDEEASELDAFEQAHDLSKAFGGLFELPPLWLVREGEHMLCDTGRTFDRLPFAAVVNELAKVGDWIADHLMSADAQKWHRVVEAWRNRDRGNAVNLVSWSASVEAEVAHHLISKGLIEPPKSFAEAANDNNELLIAARMAGALPMDQIAQILEVARRFEHHTAERLDTLSSAALAHLSELGRLEPFAEGEELANFTRHWLKIGPSQRIDVFKIVDWLGIEVLLEPVGPATFDGLAIAGTRYGPGAFINSNGDRIRSKSGDNLKQDPGARVNLAHELCHLLIDREHPLSAIEVLRSRMPSTVEARARAFAGEFLLPSITAARIWDQAGSPTELNALHGVLQELVDSFGVSFSVASWKVEHGARQGMGYERREKVRELKAVLDLLATYR